MENRTIIDDDRIEQLEDQLKQARTIAEEREMMYEEVSLVEPVCLCGERVVKSMLDAGCCILLCALFQYLKLCYIANCDIW